MNNFLKTLHKEFGEKTVISYIKNFIAEDSIPPLIAQGSAPRTFAECVTLAFVWDKTPEKYEFWGSVATLFYKKYPLKKIKERKEIKDFYRYYSNIKEFKEIQNKKE